MHKHSTYEQLGLPGRIGEVLFLVSLALTLSPYFPGLDFGALRVPALPDSTRNKLKLLGPILLAASALLFYPLWPEPTQHFRSAERETEANVVDVVFKNSSSRYVNLDWLDPDEKPGVENHHPLGPGESQEVGTYAGHAWRFSDANNDEILRQVVIGENTRLVEYRQFPSWFWISASVIAVLGIAGAVRLKFFRSSALPNES
jgi:hypothetical protein